MKKIVSKLNNALFFILGVASFFVQNEPSPFEYIGIIILLLNLRYFKTSDFFSFIFLFILLNISSFFSYDIEKSLIYNFITIYLILIGFLIFRIGALKFKIFLYGCVLGITLTCLFTFFYPEVFDVWYYNRLKGGFKDPNVLAPTTLFSLILMIESRFFSNKKILLIILLMGLIIILLAQSRAALGISILYLSYKLFFESIKLRVITILSIIFLWVNYSTDPLVNTYNNYFGSRTDDKRFKGQFKALSIATLLGNGATSSDYYVKHSPHNSYVRLISDNGVLSFTVLLIWFFYLLLKSKYNFSKFYLLFLAMLIGLVIDTLHWRILFIYISGILFIHKNTINGKLHLQSKC